MPKQVLEINNFAGGLNAYKDARDIEDTEFVQNWNAVVSKAGIIKVAGMGKNYIATDYFQKLPTHFQEGFGLFQFSADYAISTVSGDFSIGITTGTRAGSNSTTAHTLEDISSTSSTDDEYNSMILFIYEGTGIGESRVITNYVGSTRVVTTEAFATTLDTTSKYIIYSWNPDSNWSGVEAVSKKDIITNGIYQNSNEAIEYISNEFTDDYFILSRATSISDEQSKNLGFIIYGKTFTLVPGTEYKLSFDCAVQYRYYNLVSKGSTDASATSYGDKVPWVQLYSTTVADTKGSIKAFSATAVSTSSNWGSNATYTGITPNNNTGRGKDATFNLVISGSTGTTATIHIVDRGEGYAVGDVITFRDPANSSKTAAFTISSVNITGLALMASSDNSDKTEWKSGIVGNGSTSKYIDDNYDNNYIANGDFTNGTTSWTSGSKVTAAEAGAGGSRYDEHDGSLLLQKSSVNGNALLNPWDNSWNEYIYQDVTLDENTTYHLNFLYDNFESNGGIAVAVYDTTNSKVLLSPLDGMRTATRPDFLSDGSPHIINYRFGSNKASGSDFSDLKDMNYTSFRVGHAPSSSTTTTCTVRIAFAALQPLRNARIGTVTLYKAHNDLVTMNYHSEKKDGNPYSNAVGGFKNYSVKFTVPENYSSVSTWQLILHAGQYSQRDNSSITQLGGIGVQNEQVVYFDNIKLVSEEGDTITALSNNTDRFSDISLHSKLSDTWMNNLIRWNGLNCQPNYQYINGMLKISDGNFTNKNVNKLLYYSGNKGTYGSGTSGWRVSDKALQEPPSLSANSANSSTILSQFTDCIPLLNNRYIQELNISLIGSVNIRLAGNTSVNDRNNNSIASAYGAGDLQGFVTRHWFSSLAQADGESIFSDTYDGNQVLIPRYYPNETAPSVSTWYADNIINNNFFTAGGEFDSDSDTFVATGGFLSSELFYPRTGIKQDNTFERTLEQFRTKEFAIPSEVLKHISDNLNLENAGNIAKIDIEFEMQYVGKSIQNAGGTGPSYTLNIEKSTANDATMDDINVNWTPHTFPVQGFSKTRNYGNGDTNVIDAEFTAANYNAPEDDGECLNVYVKSFGSGFSSVGIFKTTIADSITFDENEISQDEPIVLKLSDDIGDFSNNFVSDMLANTPHLFYSSSPSYTNLPEIYHQNIRRGAQNAAVFSRILINKLNIHYYNTEAFADEEDTLANLNPADAKVLFQWDDPKSEGSLSWGERSFTVAISSVNIFNEESSINEISDIIGGIGEPTENFPDGQPIIPLGYAPTIDVRLKESYYHNSYITKTKFYMKDENSEIYYLQFYIDHKTGKMHSTTSGIKSSSAYNSTQKCYDWNLERENFLNFNEVNSYESETFVSQEDAVDSSNLTCRYKTSVIANNRLYVGNIMQNGEIFGDRMIKSPINKYNILPKSSFIDVAINDGDEITALAYYQDKLLQYKKRKVFVINISGDFEFLEDTFENAGVLQQSCVTKTPYGIVWANKSGCYMYNGSQLVNLIDNKIPVYEVAGYTNNFWNVGERVPSIAYSEKDDVVLVKFLDSGNSVLTTPDSSVYHFPTNSWLFSQKTFNDSEKTDIGAVSNFITDENGDILFYKVATSSDSSEDESKYDGIKKYNYEPYIQYQNAQSTGTSAIKLFNFITKDFTFGNLAARKKIYKVYVTYKTTSGNDSKVLINTAINGGALTGSTPISATKSKFFGTSTACYHVSNGLLNTSGAWKTAELRFTTSSNYNNINSFQLQFSSAFIDPGFEINDISIVFKTKRIK